MKIKEFNSERMKMIKERSKSFQEKLVETRKKYNS